MAGAWIGFAGSLIGSALAALIAVFVMNRTNKANKRIASKSARADFSNQLISITADYCGLLEQAHQVNSRKSALMTERDMNIQSNYGQYESSINDLELKLSELINEISVFLYKVEIMFISHDDFRNGSYSFTKIKEEALSGISKPKFNENLLNFRKSIADDVKDYIQ